MKKKICLITGTRADYPRIKNIIFELKKQNSFEINLIVTGTHLVKSMGYSAKEIEKDKIKINHKVKIFNDPIDDSLLGNLSAFSKCALEVGKILKKEKPDLAIVTVDRVETLAIASACALMNIPIAHFQGGEISGTIDESIRHSVSKLSHFHFVSTSKSKQRLIQMGENKKNIFNVGCPYIETLEKIKKGNSQKTLEKYFKKKRANFVIFIMHSVTTNLNEAKILFDEVVHSLEVIKEKYEILYFIPNSDPGCNYIIKKLKKIKNIRLISNLYSEEYLHLLKNCNFLIGNSSSGIREAASFKTPVINIGTRQQGREKNTNVLDVKFSTREILKKVKFIEKNKIFKSNLKNLKNIYGKKNTSQKVVNIIKKSILIKKNNLNILEKKFNEIKI